MMRRSKDLNTKKVLPKPAAHNQAAPLSEAAAASAEKQQAKIAKARRPGALKAGSDKRRTMAERLSRELEGVRSLLREALEQYDMRLNSRLASLQSVMRGEANVDEGRLLPSAKRMTSMLEDIRKLKVKPKKGRAKDLLRLEELVDSLQEVIIRDFRENQE